MNKKINNVLNREKFQYFVVLMEKSIHDYIQMNIILKIKN